MRSIDITNKKFGNLTAIKYAFSKKGFQYWLFKCDCGSEKVIKKYDVMHGLTISCGCYCKQSLKERATIHGLSKKRLYSIFCLIKSRCYNKKNKAFKNYGGRGIKMSEKWLNNVESFYSWAIQNGYKIGLTIDRIDNNGDYSPENCRWVDRNIQNRNRRNNIKYQLNGKEILLCEIPKKFKISYNTCYYLHRKGLLLNFLKTMGG